MKRTLIVIDMQKDFIDGALGTPEAQTIVPAVREKISTYRKRGDEIIFTRDTHGPGLPFHPGGEKAAGGALPEGHAGLGAGSGTVGTRRKDHRQAHLRLHRLGDMEFERIELVGLCTDICVVSNGLILKAMFPEAEITVDPACCAGVTPESHQAALLTMKMCQIQVPEQ